MPDMKEGYVKFSVDIIEKKPVQDNAIRELNVYRQQCFDLNLIGAKRRGELKGMGFGNISVKHGDGFIISGTGTGRLSVLTKEHYSRITKYDLQRNYVECSGVVPPSSEALTHAAAYDSDAGIKAVIHIHDSALWRYLLQQDVPKTAPDAAYGTPEMAYEVKRLCKEYDATRKKIIVMKGHEEGVLVFGKSLEEAFSILMKHYHTSKKRPSS